MNAESFVKAEMVAFAHREAAGFGGTDNMLAIALVLKNRQRAGWEGGSLIRIMEAAPLFRGSDPPQAPAINLRSSEMQSMLMHVDDIYSGGYLDKLTEGALYYCELSKCSSAWFMAKVARDQSHERVAKVGPVDFFR